MGGVATLRFHKMPTGCIVCVSHPRNHDRYFRYTVGSARKQGRKAFMFHRWVWEQKREHVIKTNRERKLVKKEKANGYY